MKKLWVLYASRVSYSTVWPSKRQENPIPRRQYAYNICLATESGVINLIHAYNTVRFFLFHPSNPGLVSWPWRRLAQVGWARIYIWYSDYRNVSRFTNTVRSTQKKLRAVVWMSWSRKWLLMPSIRRYANYFKLVLHFSVRSRYKMALMW